MKMKFKIHSVSDIITNSSEIIFIVDDGKTEEFILEMLKPYIKLDKKEDNWSGAGGEVEVYEEDNEGKKERYLSIDWSMENTLDAARELFRYKKS